MSYRRITKKLTPAVIAEAETLIARGEHKPSVEWREPRTGFALHFYPFSGSFLLRTRQTTITLGAVGSLTAHIARHLAEQSKLAIRHGRDAKLYVAVFKERLEEGDDLNGAHAKATIASAKSGGIVPGSQVWTVDELIERFVKHKSGEFKEGRWRRQFAKLFQDEAWKAIRSKRINDLDHSDFFAFKRAVVPPQTKATARAARLVSMMVAMFDFALNEHAPESGLLGRDPLWRAVSVSYRSRKRRRAPEPQEIARMLWAIDHHGDLGDGAVTASLTLRALLFFVVSTAQRVGASAELRRADILEHEGRKDWRVAHFSADVMKGRKGEGLAHAVPMPPALCAKMEELWAVVDPDGKSAFAFPAARGSGHVAATGLNQLFAQLRGDAKDAKPTTKGHYKGKPGPKPRPRRAGPSPDLFERYLRELKQHQDQHTHFVLHDIRRSLTNYLAERGLGGAASAILAHVPQTKQEVRTEESLEEQMERTTSRHYFTAQRLTLKTQGLELWNEALAEALAAERDRVGEIARSHE